MFRRYPSVDERAVLIVTLLRRFPHGLLQAEIARQLNYPAKMVMEDLQRLEDLRILVCEDGTGRLQLFEYAWV